MRWFSWFFFVSGFASLVYEVVWLRLAMAAFGVTTPFVSIVLSVFMAGLAIGSWAGGRFAKRHASEPASFDLRRYALIELAIGIFGVGVPLFLTVGRHALESVQGDATWSGTTYCLVSGLWIALALLPGCTCMGATFPLAMSAIRKHAGEARSFSRLYLANVLGATAGTLVSAFVLIELLGFHGTLWATAALNVMLACAAWSRSARLGTQATLTGQATLPSERSESAALTVAADRGALALLFATGLLSMGMEVVWVRQYTPHLGTVVYAFASILALYLLATFLGSTLYRRRAARGGNDGVGPLAWVVAGVLGLTTLIAADPLVNLPREIVWVELRTLFGIGPVAAAFGFLTPMLVDRFSGGDPDRAGRAYAVNVIGCILGPLVGCFLLLPWLGERWSIVALSLPLFAFGASRVLLGRAVGVRARAGLAVSLAAGAAIVYFTHDFDAGFRKSEVRRDATATAIATRIRGEKQLYINGISISRLTPITKMMVHLPMTWRPEKPRSLLVICFGMGTSTRSGLTWGVPCTTVELCSVVPQFFAYFHPDAEKYLQRPGAEIVIDDGRRYLERTPRTFDVITIDPPPPVEAAASSLLYSREFYQVIRKRLSPSGILQQWFPEGDPQTLAAIIRALQAEFPHLRAFKSVHGGGVHFLASVQPLGTVTGRELAARLSAESAADFVEWEPGLTSEKSFDMLLAREYPLDPESLDPGGRTLTDDRAVNEYFFLRRLLATGTPRRQ